MRPTLFFACTVHTSQACRCSRLYDPVVASVEQRVALWTKLNISHQEDTQVLRWVCCTMCRVFCREGLHGCLFFVALLLACLPLF